MEPQSPPSVERKRKRDAPAAEELEIDIDAPEPPSKKALRRAKKGKPPQEKRSSPSPPPARDHVSSKGYANGHGDSENSQLPETKDRRGEHGVWIGNLPWQVDKAALRSFLTERGGLSDEDITRVHMPPPSKHQEPSGIGVRAKPHNKGFAYVDFSTVESQKQAIELSETLLNGRALLIKDAQSFAGRPAAPKTDHGDMMAPQGNPPNKRIFVGNLSFDTDRQMVREHFEQCGDVEQVFLATFEDTGRCKGYGWITFADLESAERAVRGLVLYEKSKPKAKGRPGRFDALLLAGHKLRAEFAEDATVRYQKRYGKHSDQNHEPE